MPSSSIISPRQRTVDRGIWLAIGAVIALEIALMHYIGLKLDLPNAVDLLFITAFVAGAALLCRYLLHDEAAYLFGSVFNQGTFITIGGSILCQLGAWANLPLTDDTLITIDRFFGFDWRQFVQWVDAHPGKASLLTIAYQSTFLQGPLLICLLFVCKQSAHAQRVQLVLGMTLLVTVMLSSLFPAVAGYVYYHIDVQQFKHLRPAAAHLHEATLLALRNHSATSIYPFVGIVTFPSFHAVLAILFMYASLPFRWLRCFIIPLNITMLFSCMSDGGHWLIDVIAGILIGLAGIWVAERLLPRKNIDLP